MELKMKMPKKNRIRKWFVGSWSPALAGLRSGDLKFRFTYNWDLSSQVEIFDFATKTYMLMNLDTFKAAVTPKLKNGVYVLYTSAKK